MQDPVLILGASGVIGAAIARRLCDDGPVILHGHEGTGRLESLAGEIDGAATVSADLCDPDQVSAMFERLAAEHEALRGIVFAVARPFPHKLTHKTDWSVFETQIDTQFKALHLSLSAALPLLEAHDGTARALVLSTEYVLGPPPVKIAPYVAAKAALTTYARVLAQEWLGRGVRVHILAPGMVESALTAELPDMYLQQVAKTMPEKRLTSAEDVAATAAFLMSEAGDVMYGTVVLASRAQRR
uniref:Putative short chain dehydrogenase n=1 Tax=uncultured marine microorganism HF4000_APKG8K5 TaxID=455555 RepID=B3TB44_9ZZZZ|nr:putative short chain dehydrogenase [uncultured marine microorganism HF4000_APKG8K5]